MCLSVSAPLSGMNIGSECIWMSVKCVLGVKGRILCVLNGVSLSIMSSPSLSPSLTFSYFGITGWIVFPLPAPQEVKQLADLINENQGL